MKNRIKARIVSGTAFTEKQLVYIEEQLGPNFDRECAICMQNLCMAVGIDPWEQYPHKDTVAKLLSGGIP